MTAPWKRSPLDHENPFLSYFDGEMRYLRDAGREFAKAQPDAAARLGMAHGDPHDSVRSAFEGFAFLMARLQMKLDDGAPEITDQLVDNLYGYAGRAIPSLSIIECRPVGHAASTGARIAAGAVVRSAPVGPDGVRCLYRTTQPVQLLPLSIADAAATVRADARSVIRLTFRLGLSEQRDGADLSRIRLYLHGERPAAAALYAALTRQVATIGLRLPSVRDGDARPLDNVRFEAAGFGPSTRLWPGAPGNDNTQDGEQTLLEYFVFPQKFHFVDLCGFDVSLLPAGESQMTFEIELDDRMPGDYPVGPDSFRLFCTPVINLFEVDALPLQPTDRHDREQRVIVQPGLAGHVEPYGVLEVTAADPEDSARHAYRAFASFKHRGWMLRYENPERYYHTSMRFGAMGRELWVTLAGQLWEGFQGDARRVDDRPPPDRYLTVRALANNGRLPRLALAEATITDAVSGFAGVASVRNLTAPTLPVYPPRHHPEYDWRVLGHYTAGGANELNAIRMAGAPALREALELYDWSADDSIGRCDALRRRAQPVRRPLHKLPALDAAGAEPGRHRDRLSAQGVRGGSFLMTESIMRLAAGIGLALCVSACGTWQSVKDGMATVTRAVFETKVKQMNLVVTARGALNQDRHGASLPVVLRIWQLTHDRPFATATYAQLLDGSDALKAATVWSRDVTLGPGETLKLSVPIGDEVNHVGVAAFFRDPGDAEWSVLVPKSQWKKTDPVKLVAVARSLEIDTERP